ncbi:Uncharacterized protein DAT39_021862 [Clarias magur]|uniref:Uncharacterized protein n=1 Tax=Clarias magur TaxID=1594786 RepID=A0A8J4TCB7_CLAMG|nr:Uncharacterized protein DAT39_021862 [Clarias magur]
MLNYPIPDVQKILDCMEDLAKRSCLSPGADEADGADGDPGERNDLLAKSSIQSKIFCTSGIRKINIPQYIYLILMSWTNWSYSWYSSLMSKNKL